MIKTIRVCVLLLLAPLAAIGSQEEELSDIPVGAVTAQTAPMLQLPLSISPEALLADRLSSNIHFKGDLAEHLAAETVTKQFLRDGSWKSITPRTGRQGLDHIFIKVNSNGFPVDLMVAESKYGTSVLGKTSDGLQMSSKWRATRLRALGARYANISALETGEILYAKPPLISRYKLDVHLTDGTQVSFWRDRTGKNWCFSGTQTQLREAQKLSRQYASILQKYGTGKLAYKKRIFHIVSEIRSWTLRIYEAEDLAHNVSLSKLPLLASVTFKKPLFPVSANEIIALHLKKRELPSFSDAAVRKISNRVHRELKTLLHSRNLALRAHLAPIGAGGGAAFLDAGMQYLLNGSIDVPEALTYGAANGAAMIASGKAGFPIQWSINSAAGTRSLFPRAYVATGIPFLIADTVLGLSGNQPWEVTRRNMLMNGSHMLLATAIRMAMVKYAMWHGVTSTGVAISSLHGAAAVNATTAYWGGGALAAGGGGMAAGSVIISLGPQVAATIAVYAAFRMYDTAQQHEKLRVLFQQYIGSDNADEGIPADIPLFWQFAFPES